MSVATNWLWDPDDLKRTPSIQAEMTMEQESQQRCRGVQMIKEIGKDIGLKMNPTLATACVFFHRFYMFKSFYNYPASMMALTSLFLAGKVEETPKKCKDLVQCGKERYPRLFGDKNLMDELILLERILLQTIRFDLHVEHPYDFLLRYIKGFNLCKEYFNRIATTAWTFINDSFASTLCLTWESEVIAISMLHMSFKMTKLELEASPKLNVDGEQLAEMEPKGDWWDNYVENLTIPMMEDICHKVLDCLNDENEQILAAIPTTFLKNKE